MRKARHLLEAALFVAAWALFRILPLDAASWLGGKTGRLVGPLLRKNRVARTNLALALPEKPLLQRERILRGMWENLGRTMAELAHLPGNRLFSRISFAGLERTPSGASIFISGHLSNWELLAAIAHEHGIPVTLVYRHANNPYVDRMINRLRKSHAADMLPKGHRGAAKMAKALSRGESLAMLIDQKMNEGMAVPFFGHEAMTAPAFAQFALRYNMPVVPVRMVRVGGAHFKATVYPKLEVPKTGDDEADARAIVLAANQMLEGWIREYPEQWFWIHKRWPKEKY